MNSVFTQITLITQKIRRFRLRRFLVVDELEIRRIFIHQKIRDIRKISVS